MYARRGGVIANVYACVPECGAGEIVSQQRVNAYGGWGKRVRMPRKGVGVHCFQNVAYGLNDHLEGLDIGS